MNPFYFNHLLVGLLAVAFCVLVSGKRPRRTVLTGLAIYGVFFAKYIHWSLGLFYFFLSLGVLLSGWGFARALARRDPKDDTRTLMIVAMVLLFSPLFLFKFAMALVPASLIKTVQQNAPGFSFSALIPIGISYFSFRSAAYLIEVKRKSIKPVGFWSFLHYALFWPTLLAGPIERPGPFLEQAENLRQPARDDLVFGLARIILGFAKKTIVAALFFNVARPYLELGADFNAGFSRFSTPYLWLCVTAYYLYLYLDFSAYSDLAIGASRMMGFKIMENFRWPILATNVSDFWRRWHISLTSWVTDYIYIPLGGNRKGLFAAAGYSLIAMIAIGAWHGMNLHFIAWGMYHAIFLILYRQWRKTWKEKWFPGGLPGPSWAQRAAAWFLTFQIVNLGWVLFNFKIGQSIRIWLRLFWLG